MLEVDHLTVRHGYLQALTEISLTVAPGETLAIIGANGAGKSTLLRSIIGLHQPRAGSIRLEGRDITGLPPHARVREGIALVPEGRRLFPSLSVEENLLVAAYRGGQVSRPQGYAVAAEVLEETGLSPDANRPAGRLGLLQRKRLELARGLATRPRVLLLDEVAGGLTDPEVAQLVDIVEQVRQRSVAVVWVEHVVHALTRAVSRIICLAGGRLIAEGDPESVLANPEVKEVYLGVDIDA